MRNWLMHLTESMGFMVMAKAKGYKEKVQAYKHSIKHLMDAIKDTMGDYMNVDRIHDLRSMHEEATVLYEFARKHL